MDTTAMQVALKTIIISLLSNGSIVEKNAVYM